MINACIGTSLSQKRSQQIDGDRIAKGDNDRLQNRLNELQKSRKRIAAKKIADRCAEGEPRDQQHDGADHNLVIILRQTQVPQKDRAETRQEGADKGIGKGVDRAGQDHLQCSDQKGDQTCRERVAEGSAEEDRESRGAQDGAQKL